MITGVQPRIHHFALSAADLEATAAWYCDTFGFVEDYRYEVPDFGLHAVFLVLGELRLEIFQMAQSRAASEDEYALDKYLSVRGLKHVAFLVDDLDAARAELLARGVTVVNDVMAVPNSGGERFCFFADPDGVLVELFEAVPGREHRH